MQQPTRRIRLRSSARSDRGRERKNNEDSVHLWKTDGYALAVVADGMGGAVAGEEASRIAVETIQDELNSGRYRSPDDYKDVETDDLAQRLSAAVRKANHNILQKALRAPELRGMGTTLTLAFARQTDVVFAHVGDSRAYIVNQEVNQENDAIRQITADHSFVQALVDAGHIRPDEADGHPMGSVLYRALGQTEDVEVDVTQDVRLHIGDRLVLCSDGLTLHVTPAEIAEKAMQFDDPHRISKALLDLALSRGGKDNISVIVIIVDEVEVDGSPGLHKLEEIDIDEDDQPTIPMNPDFHSITRLHPADDASRHQNNEEPPSSCQGEGADKQSLI
jgi:protein phosphatase